jgi:TetR/AcrR family transcriptional regulator
MSTIKPTTEAAPKIKRRVLNRDKLEADIAAVAVQVFAEFGYEGTSIAAVAEKAGLSKQNLMYYFPTKQALYQRVLDEVLDEWLERMEHLAAEDQEPAEVLRTYMQAKLKFSREHPWASRVYAMEVISGAPLYGGADPAPRDAAGAQGYRGVRAVDRGGQSGADQCHPSAVCHLGDDPVLCRFFGADGAGAEPQTADRKDFDDAEQVIVDMVLAAISVPQGADAGAP